MAEKKKGGLEDDDLEALVSDTAFASDEHWQLSDLQVTTGVSCIPTATVTMVGPDGIFKYVAATGEGPVDAVYKVSGEGNGGGEEGRKEGGGGGGRLLSCGPSW